MGIRLNATLNILSAIFDVFRYTHSINLQSSKLKIGLINYLFKILRIKISNFIIIKLTYNAVTGH